MVGQKEGLIVQTSSLGSFIYAFDVAYGVAHAGMDKLTADMAIELREHGVKTVTLHPQGGCNTELMKWPGAESTVFVGRAALSISEKASGDDLNAMNGKMVFTGELAEKYGSGTVAIDNAFHYLWGGGYVMDAAKRGYIAYTNCTSTLAEVVPFGGKFPTLQCFNQNGSLNGHMQRADNARAFEGLFGAIFRTQCHQAWHFRFSNVQFFAAIIGKGDIFDDVIFHECSLLEGG